VFAVMLLAAVSASPKAAPPAQDLLTQGRVDDAITQLQERTHKNPNDADAYHLLSRAYLLIESWDKAVAPGERAVALEPNNSNYHLWLGRAYGRKAEHSIFFKAMGWARKCKSEFERAVQLNAANVPARADLAEYYLQAPGFLGGGKDKAQMQADEIAAHDQAAAHMVRARLAEDDKDYPAAERELWQAIADSPQPAGYWLDLAAFYRRRLHQDGGVLLLVGGYGLVGGVFHVIQPSAAALLLRGGRNLPGAALLARKALSSPSQSDEGPSFKAHYLLGQALEKQGDKPGAEREYRAALSLAKDYKQAQKALKRIQQQQD